MQDNKGIQNSNYYNSGVESFKDQEKERERIKKLEYQNFLKMQIEEKRLKNEQEKEKKKELLAYKFENSDNKPVKGKINKNHSNNIIFEDAHSYNNNNNYNSNTNNIINNHKQDFQSNNLEANLESDKITEDYLSYKNKLNYNQNEANNFQNNNKQQNFKEDNNLNDINNKGNYHFSQPNYYNNNQNYLTNQTDNYGLNYSALNENNYNSNNFNISQLNNNPLYNSPHNLNLATNPYSILPNFQNNTNSTNQNFVFPPFIEEMLKQYFQMQNQLISQYKDTIEKLSDKNQENYSNFASKERTNALNKIKNEQEKFKSSIGFYPIQKEQNIDMEATLNNIIDENLKKSSIINMIKNKEVKEDYDSRPISSKYTNNEKNSNNLSGNSNKHNNFVKNGSNQNSNNNFDYLYFKSKYENASESIIEKSNIVSEDDELLKASLAGFSKLVEINPKDDENFLATWRNDGQNFINPIKKQSDHISETDEMNKFEFDATIDKNNNKNMLDNIQIKEANENQEENNGNNNSYIKSVKKIQRENIIPAKSNNVIYKANKNFNNDEDIDKYYNVKSQRDFTDMNHMMILSAEDKNKSLILDETEQFDNIPEHKIEEYDDDNLNYCNRKCFILI